jgi:hypothetical protein
VGTGVSPVHWGGISLKGFQAGPDEIPFTLMRTGIEATIAAVLGINSSLSWRQQYCKKWVRLQKAGKSTCAQLIAQAENDAGANPQIVLAVVKIVRDFGHEVLGLYRTNRDVPRYFEINPAARRHRKIVFGSG